MIFDNIQNIQNYKEFKKIYTQLKFLKNLNLNEFTDNKFIIDKNSFANYIEFTSKNIDECVFEAHKKYIDIHFIISGTEVIKVCDVNELKPKNDFDYKKDIGFYQGYCNNLCYLKQGDFMVCFPQDAHMVAISENLPSAIKKIVVKIEY